MAVFSTEWFENVRPSWEKLFRGLGWTDGRRLTAVEVGSFEGRSTIWTLQNLLAHPNSRIYCIDSFSGGVEHSHSQTEGLYDRFLSNVQAEVNYSKVNVCKSLSHVGLRNLLQNGEEADFIYIDASHQAPDVLEDLVLSMRLLKPGGVCICDDYLWFNELADRIDLLMAPKIAIDAFININIRNLEVLRYQPLNQLIFMKNTHKLD